MNISFVAFDGSFGSGRPFPLMPIFYATNLQKPNEEEAGVPLEGVRGVRPHPQKFYSGCGAPLLNDHLSVRAPIL